MTARALAVKVRRLEILAKVHSGRPDAAARSQQGVLPPIDEFCGLPLAEQKHRLSAWRPTPCGVNLPPLEEFE